MKIISDIQTLNTFIKSIGKRSANLDNDLHIAACSCVVHYLDHGNYTPIVDLINAMGKSMRANSMRKWMLEFSPIVWDDVLDKDTGKTRKGLTHSKERFGNMFNMYSKDKDAFIGNLDENPFYDWDAEPAFKPLDLNKAIIALIKRADKMDDEQKAKSNLSKLEELRRLVA